MNNKLKISLLSLGVIFMPALQAASVINDTGSNGKYNGDVSGHTFLSIRPQFQSGMPEHDSLFRRRATCGPCGFGREGGFGGAFQVVGFGGRSTKSARLGEFFMFGGSNQLIVDSTQANFPQVNPLNFGISYASVGAAPRFSSTIQFNPRESVAGVGFEWRQHFGWWSDCECKWWFDISFPVVQVSNRVGFTELNVKTVGTPLAGTAANMTQAFLGTTNFNAISPGLCTTSSTMQFGLIPTGTRRSLKKTGVADVEIKIGYDGLHTDCFYVNGYVGALVPTGNRPNARYIFEPMVGHNRHAGFLFGGEIMYDMWSGCDSCLSWEINFDSRYLFSSREKRSFDLKNRPWSRYLLVYASQADATNGCVSPGINFFTQDMNVTPRFYSSMNTALVYTTMCGFQAEAGWNFWARQAEKIKLKNPFPANIFVAALDADNDITAPAQTSILSNIGNNDAPFGGIGCTASTTRIALAAPFPAGVQQRDIDFASAANPATLSNIIYGTLGYNWDWCCLPMFFGVGGSYEFTSVNTSISRWNVWGKFGVSF